MNNTGTYKSKNKIRILTAASLFDGHDAAINIMRRILQSTGAEVIHLGHNRSAEEIVDAAIQEDVHAIAITSYQGGHMEFFKYIFDLLKQRNSEHIKIFGGGGGTILPSEIEELHSYGITRIYSPDDGRAMGLQGMIDDLLEKCDFDVCTVNKHPDLKDIARLITIAENHPEIYKNYKTEIENRIKSVSIPVLGITGTGGAGKSTITDELTRRFINHLNLKICILSIDPTRKKSGGALLGDRIRMNSIHHQNVFMRSMATRESGESISSTLLDAIEICKNSDPDLVIIETSGIGQSDSAITNYCDVALYIMTPEFGAPSQLEKIDMLDHADVVVINKADKKGSDDALREVRKQYKRNFSLWDKKDEELPIFKIKASQYNDPGTNDFFKFLVSIISSKTGTSWNLKDLIYNNSTNEIIPANRTRYLAEIKETIAATEGEIKEQSETASNLYALHKTAKMLEKTDSLLPFIEEKIKSLQKKLFEDNKNILNSWEATKKKFSEDYYEYKVRDKVIRETLSSYSLSGLRIPKISTPTFNDWGDIITWCHKENFPGEFPYTAGVFPLKRRNEDPARMFAGEGGPERTNKRFHYLAKNQSSIRLSTAFDSVTLYGEDPATRPDIYGKIGNSGVSVASLDDAKILYSGFNLCHPSTSISMTINGPAPMVLAFFMNAAIDQQCEIYIKENGLQDQVDKKIEKYFLEKGSIKPVYNDHLPEGHNGLGLYLLGITGEEVLESDVYNRIKSETLRTVRGTVQADILKEDQAQNTCIFSTDFALKMMGDIQEYFVKKEIRNFYSVSVSGYHIAEAGANPISQLAFTLANGFTYVEYYLSRGMKIDDFAPNFSFFFSNGLDPEYSVIGRVARRIWARAMKYKYNANDRSQKLKYHIQTSGRSLHAQEIAFNDIRTTLQALYAIYDNCNSLHTNAYDEAITTPTEESVRRAFAIQLIINQELGLTKNENPLQGSYIIEELTDLVEEAVLTEFERISSRGGVPGAMETMYQRSKIQEESLYYEEQKHTGALPIIGVNTFLDSKGSPTIIPKEVIRARYEEKDHAINSIKKFKVRNSNNSTRHLQDLKTAAMHGENIFTILMDCSRHLTLGQMTEVLYQAGGAYRRNM